MKKLLLLALLLAPILVHGQGSAYSSFAVDSTGKPISLGLVTVCTISTNPCPAPNKASIFSDQALTLSLANPIGTDLYGNFNFWTTPATYWIQVTSGASSFGPYPITVSCDPTNCGKLSASSYNNVVEADTQLGADIGAKLIAAQTALPSTGGIIDARGILTGSCTSNVSLGTDAKPVMLLVNSAAQITGTCQITIAGSASGIDGGSAVESFDFDQRGTAQWTYTGTNGALITVSPGVRAPVLKNLRLSGTGSSGTADCVFMSGTASNSTSVTSSLVSNVSCDGFARDGFHLENDVYGFNWYNVAGTNNGRYGFYGSDNGSTTSAVIQAKLFGYRFCGNKSTDAQVYLHSPSSASVEAGFDGGTVCDTPVANTSGNGFHFDGTTAFITVKSTHFETIGGSVAGGTPDISNSPIVITTANGLYNVEGNNFVATSAKCTGGVLRNAIAESFAGGATNLVFSRGNAYGNYAKSGPAGTNCVVFDGSGVTAGLTARIGSDEHLAAANFNLGSHVFPTLASGDYFREDGTNFSIVDGSGNVKATISNATGLATFNGGVTTPLQLASTVVTGTAPLVVASTTNVANLNASSLNGATFAAPGAIGNTTPVTGFTLGTGGSALALIKKLTDTPGAITVNANTCTDRTVADAGILATAVIGLSASYALDAGIVIGPGQADNGGGNAHYRICNVTAGNITLNAAAAFNLTVTQ